MQTSLKTEQNRGSSAPMKSHTRKRSEIIYPRFVKKLFNFNNKDYDFTADTDDGCSDSSSDDQDSVGDPGFEDKNEDQFGFESNAFQGSFPIIRRRKSETLRAQYINNKELRICVGTWNVGGKLPSDDLDIADWLDLNKHADIYVLGFQEIVPLNAGNIFGAEDTRPVPKWESIIRETLNKITPVKSYKSLSDPPSPSRFKDSEDFPDIEEETDSDGDDMANIHPINEEDVNYNNLLPNDTLPDQASVYSEKVNFDASKERELQRQFSSPRRLDRLNCLKVEDSIACSEAPSGLRKSILTKQLSMSEKIGLSWPEPPLNLAAKSILGQRNSFKSVQSFKTLKSFTPCNSFKTFSHENTNGPDAALLINEIDLEAMIRRKKKPHFVRIVSKQMVGVFLSVWVRRSLRKHVHNVKVSTVRVGAMGYIGNKGSISVSMSIYQTLFCFICSHLASGEKDGDELRRNANVQEIHRRTQFRSISGIGCPKNIHDHEKIIWLGDLNYRLNLSYEKTRDLISKKEWSKLAEKDQLVRELKKGRAFDGWTEGTLKFPPTYKYEMNSQKYYGEDPKVGRRIPAWCDRILSFGKGLKLVNYKRTEKTLSDHRPVTAVYLAEVEVFSPKKLQKALIFTDAELENGNVIQDMEIDELGRLRV